MRTGPHGTSLPSRRCCHSAAGLARERRHQLGAPASLEERQVAVVVEEARVGQGVDEAEGGAQRDHLPFGERRHVEVPVVAAAVEAGGVEADLGQLRVRFQPHQVDHLEGDGGLQQRGVDLLAAAGALPPEQRQRDAVGEEHRCGGVGHPHPGPQRRPVGETAIHGAG